MRKLVIGFVLFLMFVLVAMFIGAVIQGKAEYVDQPNRIVLPFVAREEVVSFDTVCTIYPKDRLWGGNIGFGLDGAIWSVVGISDADQPEGNGMQDYLWTNCIGASKVHLQGTSLDIKDGVLYRIDKSQIEAIANQVGGLFVARYYAKDNIYLHNRIAMPMPEGMELVDGSH